MKLTLRKANAVQAAINTELKQIDLSSEITLNEFEDVREQIESVRDRFVKNSSTREKLIAALYEIRAKVAQANASAGINDMLAKVAYLEKQISYNAMLAGRGSQTALRVLNGQVKKAAESKDEGFGYSRRDVTTSVLTPDEVEQFKLKAAAFKRDKQRLQDQLLELNVRTEIELTTETVSVLTETGIL